MHWVRVCTSKVQCLKCGNDNQPIIKCPFGEKTCGECGQPGHAQRLHSIRDKAVIVKLVGLYGEVFLGAGGAQPRQGPPARPNGVITRAEGNRQEGVVVPPGPSPPAGQVQAGAQQGQGPVIPVAPVVPIPQAAVQQGQAATWNCGYFQGGNHRGRRWNNTGGQGGHRGQGRDARGLFVPPARRSW